MRLGDIPVLFLISETWRQAGRRPGRRLLLALDYALLTAAYIILSLQPVVVGQVINTVQRGGPAALHNALLWSATYGGTIVAFWAFNGPARVIERRLAFNLYRDFVDDMYRKLTAMPLRWHRDHHSGDTISRINKAAGALGGFAGGQFVMFQIGIRFAVSLIALAFYSWMASMAALASSLAVTLLIGFFNRRLVPLIKEGNKRGHYMQAGLHDYIGNIITVLTLRLQERTLAEIGRRLGAMKEIAWSEITLGESKWASVGFLLIIAQAAIVGFYIALNYREGAMMLGNVAAVFQCLMAVNMVFFQSLQTFEGWMRQKTDMHSIDGFLDDYSRLVAVAPSQSARDWKQLEIRNLFFTHHEGEDKLHHLRDVSLALRRGQRVALIGGSGSGKTTLLTLLRGLYDAEQVTLALDGASFGSLSPLAPFATLVPQDSEIFENTILYNLTLDMDVPDALVQQALFATTFADVAAHLPNGLLTDIRERGVNLSGGQKQRLALTRGLIAARHSSLLLLDEPTSSVDLPTEAAIFDRLFAALGDAALIASIHRLHLLPRFDHICLMENGAIIEQGSFHDLLALRGEFYDLWQQHLNQRHPNLAERMAG